MLPLNSDEERYEYINFVDEEPKEEPEKQPDDETPNKKETIIGILLGLGYCTVFSAIPFYLLTIFFFPYTSADLAVLSTIAQIITAVIVVGSMMLVSKRVVKKIAKGFNSKALLSGITYAAAIYLSTIILNLLDSMIFGSVAETNANQSTIEELLLVAPLLGAVFTCIIAPIAEEVIFRYYLFKPLSKKNLALAFIITALAFGGIHMMSSISNYAGTGDLAELLNDLRSLPAYVAAGAIFCIVYYKKGKLAHSILAHMIYNGVATALSLISIANAPLNIVDVSTTSSSIEFSLKINEATVQKIELYSKDDAGEITLEKTMTAEQASYQDLRFDNLPSFVRYEIHITYSYEGLIEETTSVISTSARTRRA